jgi:hypothetical protein
MKQLRSVVDELVGLFVEDRGFALAIAIWTSFVGVTVAGHMVSPVACGIGLFAGLAIVLVASVVNAARKT